MSALYVIGRGPSVGLVDWDAISDHDWLCISGGINVVPWAPEHWVAVDASEYFPHEWAEHDTLTRHVPDSQEGWPEHERTRRWEIVNGLEPSFERGPLTSGSLGMRGRMVGRYSGIYHCSALMAVQVAHRLGYRDLCFVGCDFTDPLLAPVVDVLEEWHVLAGRLGFNWLNLSPLSHLQRFVPSSERMIAV
jgi:hypothetical protein